jgi:hypothetical protein
LYHLFINYRRTKYWRASSCITKRDKMDSMSKQAFISKN